MYEKLKLTSRKVTLILGKVKVPVDMLLSVLVLSLILVALGVNLFSKIQEGRRDYEVYVAEQEALNKLIAENEDLKKRLEYYNSLEYKLLYARDSLNRVRPEEKLYELSENVILYTYEPEPVHLYSELKPIEVWKHLLFEGIL